MPVLHPGGITAQQHLRRPEDRPLPSRYENVFAYSTPTAARPHARGERGGQCLAMAWRGGGVTLRRRSVTGGEAQGGPGAAISSSPARQPSRGVSWRYSGPSEVRLEGSPRRTVKLGAPPPRKASPPPPPRTPARKPSRRGSGIPIPRGMILAAVAWPGGGAAGFLKWPGLWREVHASAGPRPMTRGVR